MSQMPQQAALSNCPNCEWPLDTGDRFCGACGYDLSALPARPDDHPTVPLNGSAPPAGGGAAGDGDWPLAAGPDGSATPAATHLPADLPGTDSDGDPLPPSPPTGSPVSPASGVRFDRPPEPDEYPLQAPDPRIADLAAPA